MQRLALLLTCVCVDSSVDRDRLDYIVISVPPLNTCRSDEYILLNTHTIHICKTSFEVAVISLVLPNFSFCGFFLMMGFKFITNFVLCYFSSDAVCSLFGSASF